MRPCLHPEGNGEALRPQELRIEEFGLIACAVVGKDRHDGVARADYRRQADGPGDIDARGAAKADPLFFDEVEDVGVSLLRQEIR